MKLASAAKDAYGCVMRMSEIAKLLALDKNDSDSKGWGGCMLQKEVIKQILSRSPEPCSMKAGGEQRCNVTYNMLAFHPGNHPH